jgi:hypothetical protein
MLSNALICVRVLITKNEVYASYPESLEVKLKEVALDPVSAAERFVAEGVTVAFSPLDKPADPSKVVPTPRRFVKPVQLSNLRQTLSKDPEYFKR